MDRGAVIDDRKGSGVVTRRNGCTVSANVGGGSNAANNADFSWDGLNLFLLSKTYSVNCGKLAKL